LSGKESCGYGGHTPCVELIGCPDDEPDAGYRPGTPHLVLDAGSGLFTLGQALVQEARGKGELHILLSHCHYDHVAALPFFAPLYVKGNRIVYYGDPAHDLESGIQGLFGAPYFVLEAEQLPADLAYRPIVFEGMDVTGMWVRAAKNSHPGGSISYRVQYGPHVVVYSTDHEVGDQPKVDSGLVELARGADLWILDGQMTAEEYEHRRGWGHSSHPNAVELALTAGVKTIVLFHHDPRHDDATLDRMEREATGADTGTETQVIMARDGMTLDVPDEGYHLNKTG
jgi:phosphoribosyl 1,2-cyclic phosphodiesterase